MAAADDTDTAAVSGRLVNDGQPVPGATVRALDTSELEVGTTTSDDNGRWNLELPVGQYTFEVVPDSLPEGVSVQGTVTREVAAGRTNTVVFTFGAVRTSIETPLYER
ncbi:MAG: carboxypeptidase-like regulatory domain-containing protein, partial [Mycobacterium sp.]